MNDATTTPADGTDHRKPLRIALFSGNYNYVVDGPVKALNRLVGFLEAQGHEVLVFAPTIKNPPFKHTGTLISAPSIALPGSRSEYRFSLGMPERIKKQLRDFKPDLIQVAAPDYLGYSALKFGRKHAIPVVASFHTRFDTYPRYYGARWLEKYLTNYMRHFYGRCEHVYAPSQSMIDELTEDGIGKDLRLWTRGVDFSLFHPEKRDLEWRRSLGFADDDVVVGFVGRVVLEKGIDVFVETLKQVPNVKALIIGEGPERANFEGKLKDGVFTGYLGGEDLARGYASADIFFNPSITETFGNVTLEAMASGAVPVCANAAGSATLVDHGRTGLLAEPDAPSFVPMIKRLAENHEERAAMAAAAREEALTYSWDVILSRLVDNFYEAIANYQPEASAAPARAQG